MTEKTAGVAATLGVIGLIAGYFVFLYSRKQDKISKPKASKKSTKSILSSLPSTPTSSTSNIDDSCWEKKTSSVKAETSDLRGYRKLDDGKLYLYDIVSNVRSHVDIISGRVTTYFNREISQRDKEIIGDFSPKLLSSTSTVPQPIPAAKSVQSAWNAAGTWEEKDCSVFGFYFHAIIRGYYVS